MLGGIGELYLLLVSIQPNSNDPRSTVPYGGGPGQREKKKGVR